MKKLLPVVLLASALCACQERAESANSQDFAAVVSEFKKNDDAGNGNLIVAMGGQGDFIVRLAETEQLKAIADKRKTAKFLSIEMPAQYISKGFCLVNVVPYNTMEALGVPDSKCSYRLFCGSESDMNYDEYYAVELCDE